MILSVHQPQYLPWLGYFDKIAKSDAFVFLDNVQYKKREFQNRNRIRTKDGWIWLTVPVITKDRFSQKISDVEINNEIRLGGTTTGKASNTITRRRRSSLATATSVRDFTGKHGTNSIDINLHLSRYLPRAVSASRTPVSFESELGITTTSTQRIIDICTEAGADTYLSGAGGKDYMDETLFTNNGITLEYQQFNHPVYPQNFDGLRAVHVRHRLSASTADKRDTW